MASNTSIQPTGDSSMVIAKPKNPPRHVVLNKLYALPIPLRTYPLPTFVPSNPLSLFHLLYTWLSHVFKPPSSHPKVLYEGWLSPESRSVHITDPHTIRDLWEQGFFGKGTLSRSEPSWLERDKKRKGASATETAEEYTRQRRAERQHVKWERARKEREAIDRKLQEEKMVAELRNLELLKNQNEEGSAEFLMSPVEKSHNHNSANNIKEEIPDKFTSPNGLAMHRNTAAPVGPMELLALPNSDCQAGGGSKVNGHIDIDVSEYEEDLTSTVEELEALIEDAMRGTDDTDAHLKQLEDMISGIIADLPVESMGKDFPKDEARDELYTVEETEELSETTTSSAFLDEPQGPTHINSSSDVVHQIDLNGSAEENNHSATANHSRSPKSVRISPTVEQRTFYKSSPLGTVTAVSEAEPASKDVTNQEHLQLSMEEAFFLSYGLGVLKVLDPSTQTPITITDLFQLCRMSSYFPPQVNFIPCPDDPFMLSYVVYHHFRALGWVVRGGVKFAVDFLLYNRGPVFSHAEFAILILPSYSDAYWSANDERKQHVTRKVKREWHWLHAINRVNTQVKKTLVLVYVDVPPPLGVEEEQELGIAGVLGRYGVREMIVKRWLYNRTRK